MWRGLTGALAAFFIATTGADRTAPLPVGDFALAGTELFARRLTDATTRGGPAARARLRALPDVLAMFAAPADLFGCRGRLAIEDLPDFLHQIFGETGLRDEGVTAGLSRTFGDASEGVASQRHDRNRRRPFVGFQTPRPLPPVHDWERQIHEDDIRVFVGGSLQRLHAVAGLDDLEPAELEVFGIHFARIRVIVHQQHARPREVLVHRRPFNGSVSVKIDPLPTSLCSVIRPSIICSSRRQIERP